MAKILFLVTQSEYGGAQRYIYEIASHLDPKKYDILVAAGQGDREFFKKLKNTQVRPMYLKHLRRMPWPWQIILSIKEIFSLLKKERPNILFLCSTTAGLLGSIASPIYSRKFGGNSWPLVIYRIGGWAFRDPRPFWQNKILLWLEKITAPLKDKVIVNSEIDRQLAIKYKICPPEKIAKIYNGIDSYKLEFLPKEEAQKLLFQRPGLWQTARGRASASFIVGTIANFYKTKGLPYLIEAFKILNLKFQIGNWKLCIIGEGKERKRLENLIKKYNLENQVFLLGRIPDAYRYLKAFDIFVLPSLKEGLPWTILEAMIAEIPIVATSVGAIPEMIENGKEGILVKPGDSQALAEKIIWISKHFQETGNMVSQAKEKVQNQFSLEKMIKETEKILSI